MKILVIELSNLGDAILTYPALGSLWKAYPKAQFHFLVSPKNRDLFSADPRVHRTWAWDKRGSLLTQMSLIWKLFLQRFDLVVDFRNSLIPLLLMARHAPIQRRSSRSALHRVEQHLDVLKSLGIRCSNGPVGLPFAQKDADLVSTWLEPGRRPIALAAGSRSHLKRWQAQKFAQCADRLILEHQAQIFFVGDESERAIIQEVKEGMRKEATDLTGRTNIRQLAALLARVHLLVTNDSACLHAAEAMGTPVVALFGPTDERKYGPRNPRSVVLRRQLVCAPCERALCPYHHECMRWLETDEVYQAAVQILQFTVRGEPVEPPTAAG